ncbi:MAG: hypothetical protein EHM35_01600, partial [Planctomycetaceae bacterium]
MAGARRQTNNRPKQQPNRPNKPKTGQFGQPKGQKGYGEDATYKMLGGQMTVGNKSGARSWLGSPTMAADSEFNTFGGEGVLAPMGMAKNGFMQHAYVPGARQEGQAGFNVNGAGTPYAMEGMDRAGVTSNQGWNPKGKANTQAWNQMQGSIGGTGGHMELGQKGQDTGHGQRKQTGANKGPGGMPKMGDPMNGVGQSPGKPKGPGGPRGNGPGNGRRPGKGNGKNPGGLPNLPPPGAGAGMVGGVGEFPQMPEPPDNFLPMTPGYEQDWRGLNDQMSQAEGQFAQGQAMLPAAYNVANTRLQNDQDLATKRLKEDLANRGVYTPKNAAGGYGGTSPTGGGIGESMYSRDIATPYGRQFQDLASDQAGAYNSLYGDYAGANLGYAQGMNEAMLGRANEAYELDPMGLANSGYQVP